VRPKSLLGEKYVALDPGTSDALSSGSRLPQSQVARSVELQDVVNSLDQPTREKLRTLIVALGGGLAGRGLDTNQTIDYGRQDLDHLAAIAQTLSARDQDLQTVILGLDQVTAELARSDRRQQLGELIKNSENAAAFPGAAGHADQGNPASHQRGARPKRYRALGHRGTAQQHLSPGARHQPTSSTGSRPISPATRTYWSETSPPSTPA